jgi:diaminopimelate epimerase
MKAVIQEVTFHKEYLTQFGMMYSFKIKYDDKIGFYSSKYRDQKKFIPGQEVEFTEESKTTIDKQGNPHEFFVIKPLNQNKQSNFGKALKKEQARYSGFAVSYAKDLVVAGKVELEDMQPFAWTLFELMVAMDKSIES